MRYLLLAQIPGVDQAIESASGDGWPAVVLVIIVVSGLGCFGWVIRQMITRQMATEERILSEAKEREDRLAVRMAMLEDSFRTEMLVAIKANSEAMGRVLLAADSICRAADKMTGTLERFTTILDSRPCLWATERQRRGVGDGEVQNA